MRPIIPFAKPVPAFWQYDSKPSLEAWLEVKGMERLRYNLGRYFSEHNRSVSTNTMHGER